MSALHQEAKEQHTVRDAAGHKKAAVFWVPQICRSENEVGAAVSQVSLVWVCFEPKQKSEEIRLSSHSGSGKGRMDKKNGKLEKSGREE